MRSPVSYIPVPQFCPLAIISTLGSWTFKCDVNQILTSRQRHRTITPLWPLANTQVKNFNKPILKAIRAAHVQRRSWRRELEQFLKNYRCTPHSSTLFTPRRLFFGRDPRTKLPELQTRRSTHADDATVRTRDAHAKARMKRYADDRAHATQRNIEKGEVVLVQQKKVNKLSTPYARKRHERHDDNSEATWRIVDYAQLV